MSLIFIIREGESKDSEPYFYYNKRERVRTVSLIFIIRERESKDSEPYFYNKRESELGQ